MQKRTCRREFLAQLGSAAIIVPGYLRINSASAAQQAPVTYDMLIAGGRVIDPSQNLSGEYDVAILHGRIAHIAPAIPPGQARQVFDARGKIVTPGLIDIHSHVYNFGNPVSVDPDVVGFQNGITTIVDCGSVGAAMFPGFRKYVIEGAANRIHVLLNISQAGCCTDEIYLDSRLINTRAVRTTIEDNRDLILGVKVRVRGRHSDLAHDLEVMKTAREVADATGVPIMMHWSNEPELLAILKEGDILTHPFNPPSSYTSNLFGADGAQADNVLPQILALKDRGVWTDGQAATTHLQWDVAERAAAQGWFPDAISTDVARTPDGAPASLLIPMASFLHLGLSVEQVIERVTTIPGKMLNYPEKIGTLQPGVVADVSILDLVEQDFESADGTRPEAQKRVMHQQFVPVATMKSGIFLKKPAVV